MRYRFGDFVLSPGRRLLSEGGTDVPLIPRYFDLLVLLVEQRDRAVTKQEIFDRVWADVVVSDNALTQAILTIRRALGDDSRESRFVRTVSRRGYQFVFSPVVVEDDAGPWGADTGPAVEPTPPVAAGAIPAATAEPALVDAPTVDPGRWAAAAVCTALAGMVGGMCGGLVIRLGPGGESGAQVTLTLALVGMLAGLIGGGGVGAGLAMADAARRSARPARLAAGGAAAGLLTGFLAHYGARAVLSGLFGRDVPEMGGALEGLVLGTAAGLGYGAGTSRDAGGRWPAILASGAATALGGVALALAGRHLVGSTLDLMARTFAGSQVGLEPLARLFGDAHLQPTSRAIISGFEGLLFGAGIAIGLTARRRRR